MPIFFRKPNGGTPPDSYSWIPIVPEDNISPYIDYLVGLDDSEFNVGWIWDGKNQRKLRADAYNDPEFINAHVKQDLSLTL